MKTITHSSASKPDAYKRLYGFHKYWGKKPHEPLAFAIEQLTSEGDVVLDPFVGSGVVARESLIRNRRFIGFDINPLAIELTKLLVSPPLTDDLSAAFQLIRDSVRDKINSSYRLVDGRIASHYFWRGGTLRQVWLRGSPGRPREELTPTPEDISLVEHYQSHKSQYIRAPRFYSNSRINTSPKLSPSNILTGRAQRNIDLLIESIERLPPTIRNPLTLCLTAASGQMSKMVFAISGRGKTTGRPNPRLEVGSWVIGYWRPDNHFEVNVWNCFERRVSKLMNALRVRDALHGLQIVDSMDSFGRKASSCYLACQPCQKALETVPDASVNLILTDPPHSDRIPYLELSELWNCILGVEPDFDSEIVISNAKERGKTPAIYNSEMSNVIWKLSRVLRNTGFLLLLYNARQKSRWTFVSQILSEKNGLKYLGKFPCNYSVGSVVQDNRRGSLKDDVVLVFGKSRADPLKISYLASISNWSTDLPYPSGQIHGI